MQLILLLVLTKKGYMCHIFEFERSRWKKVTKTKHKKTLFIFIMLKSIPKSTKTHFFFVFFLISRSNKERELK